MNKENIYLHLIWNFHLLKCLIFLKKWRNYMHMHYFVPKWLDFIFVCQTYNYTFLQTTKGGCINLECPGFVQVSKSVPLGAVPTSYSKYGRQQFYWTISISKVWVYDLAFP